MIRRHDPAERRSLASYTPQEIAAGVATARAAADATRERRREDVAEAVAEGDTAEQIGWAREDLDAAIAAAAAWHDGTRELVDARKYLAAVEHEEARHSGRRSSSRGDAARKYLATVEATIAGKKKMTTSGALDEARDAVDEAREELRLIEEASDDPERTAKAGDSLADARRILDATKAAFDAEKEL